MTQHIDTSTYTGTINMSQTAPAIDLAIARATYLGWVDDQFRATWKGLKLYPNILRGAYYFMYFTDKPADAAKFFLDAVQPQKGELLAIDLEEQETPQVKAGKQTGALWAPVKAWLDAIELATGRKPWIYTSPGWWNYWMCKRVGMILEAPPWSNDYPLWLAHYTLDQAPLIPHGFDKWLIWQFGQEKVPGCGITPGSNPVTDCNRLAISIPEIRALVGGAPVVTPPVQPPVAVPPAPGATMYHLFAQYTWICHTYIHVAPDQNAATLANVLTSRDLAGKLIDIPVYFIQNGWMAINATKSQWVWGGNMSLAK